MTATQEVTNEITRLDIATLVIAVVGAMTGVASLAWTFAAHLLTGARVKVEVRPGWLGLEGVITEPWESFRSDSPPAAGYDRPVVAVKVHNRGRLPVSVTGWYVAVGKAQIGQVPAAWNKKVPHRLDIGEENSWFIEFTQVAVLAQVMDKTNTPAKDIAAIVSLGDSRTVHSRRIQVPLLTARHSGGLRCL